MLFSRKEEEKRHGVVVDIRKEGEARHNVSVSAKEQLTRRFNVLEFGLEGDVVVASRVVEARRRRDELVGDVPSNPNTGQLMAQRAVLLSHSRNHTGAMLVGLRGTSHNF